MLTVSADQMGALAEMQVGRFVEAMVVHLRDYAPEHHEQMGDDGQRRLIRLGLDESAAYGFDTAGPLRLYLEMMHLFGCGFAADPQYPWAAEILSDAVHDEQSRAQMLRDRAVRWLDEVGGVEACNTEAALKRARAYVAEGPGAFDIGGRPEPVAVLRACFPEKAEEVGAEALGELEARAALVAGERGLSEDEGPPLLLFLMFAMGWRCFEDPIYPWIARALDEPADGPEVRTRRLRAYSEAYLEAVADRLALGPGL